MGLVRSNLFWKKIEVKRFWKDKRSKEKWKQRIRKRSRIYAKDYCNFQLHLRAIERN